MTTLRPRGSRTMPMLVLLALVLAGCSGAPAAIDDTPAEPAPVAIDLPFLAPDATLELPLDVPVSWMGPRIPAATMAFDGILIPPPEMRCAMQVEDPCLYYRLEVPEGTTELRATLDRPDHQDVFWIVLQGPEGSWSPRGYGPFSMETRVTAPAPGTWMLQIEPQNVEDAVFRMRVQALGKASDDRPDGPWLPNLRPVPAFDFHFDAPIAPTEGRLPSIPAGLTPSSCHVEEWVLNGYVERCLRFSFGWGNEGHGPFEALVGDAPPGSLTAPVTQRVHASDGSFEDRAAGTATVHGGHLHYHVDDAYEIEILRVADGELVPATMAAKRGACTLDYMVMNWTSWDQDPQRSSESNCASIVPFPGTANPFVKRISLSRGWADVYIWDLADNYVDLTDQPDGEYVMRATVDKTGAFVETNELDNVGYTHILVHGTAVEVIERGYGNDPWDANKTVILAPWVN